MVFPKTAREAVEKEQMCKVNGLPEGFKILSSENFSEYRAWLAKAMNDPSVRRFLSGVGWHGWFKNEAPKDDWQDIVIFSDKTLVQVTFDRSASQEISIALYTIGENKKLSSGRGLMAILWVLQRYRFFRRVRSGCKTCNEESMAIHRHVFGEPWGIEPDGVWDEVNGFCDQAHFSAKIEDVLMRFSENDTRPELEIDCNWRAGTAKEECNA